LRFVSAEQRGPNIEIIRDQVREDGTIDRNVHHIPVECLSIRAGEYGLDPVDDAEAVLDILLYEMDATPPNEEFHPIVTATTLEEARNTVLQRCRKARDARYGARRSKGARPSVAEDQAHVEVLDALPGLFLQDRQLAELARIHIKAAVWAEREHMAAPTMSHKARMIDAIRTREGI
jgi:hypothetical protein